MCSQLLLLLSQWKMVAVIMETYAPVALFCLLAAAHHRAVSKPIVTPRKRPIEGPAGPYRAD